MASEFSLRCYCYLDRMQPQYAAFVGTITQGDLPTLDAALPRRALELKQNPEPRWLSVNLVCSRCTL